ncbi:permease [Shimazuella kribbensis]|uniref:permease n=1 Tax=Shimazuella kribbensis TaxID=139808 RepID=UPI0003FC1349|nr:permease [Shimazuella kribbensis]
MLRFLRSFYVEILLLFVFMSILLFFNSSTYLSSDFDLRFLFTFTENGKLQILSTIFLSIFLEGLPFILIGVFISSFIHAFINENWIWKWVPRNPILSIPAAILLGFALPICECGIVPITKRLIEKKLPVYTAFTFLLAAPIINPVTILSTYLAFGGDWKITSTRILFGAGIAITMGILFYLFFRKSQILHDNVLTSNHTSSNCCECTDENHHHSPSWKEKTNHALYHSIFEFINMGKFFVLGAFLAACFQTFIGFSIIQSLSSHEWVAILLMMAFAFGLSICSSSDAFIAASFRNVVGTAPLFAFLVYGPMMDLKNILMMVGSFRASIIWFFWGATTLLTIVSIALVL